MGRATLLAHLTAGHTRGCTTWTMTAMDGGRLRRVIIGGSPNVNAGYQLVNNSDYPEISNDFAQTLEAKYAKLKTIDLTPLAPTREGPANFQVALRP